MIELWHEVISSLPFEWAEFGFMRLALLALLFVSPLFGLAGTAVINGRMAFFSDILGHSAMTGIAVGVLLGFEEPLLAMVGFSILLALIFQLMKRFSEASSDTVLGVLMSTMVAFGIMILSKNGSFAKYTPYLVGDILTVTPQHIYLFVALFVVMNIAWLFLSNRLLLVSINPQLAASQGHSPFFYETLFSILLAIMVSLSIKMVGILIMTALLVLPAATARVLATSARGYSFWAVALSVFAGVSGLLLSFSWGTASGATIIMVLSACYALALLWSLLRR